MTPTPTVVGTIARSRLFRSRWLGRTLLACAIAVFIYLGFFPERYRAAATLTPTDPASMGLSGALGQLGAINSVFGNQAAVEVALKVARSIYVRNLVIERMKLGQRLGMDSRVRLHRWLEREVTILTLRGGIIQFESLHRDSDLAQDLIAN